MNYYPFHIGDYTTHTAHLDLLEDLAFRRLIDSYYLRECPLPVDVAECARLIRMKQNLQEVESVLKEFFVLTSEGWMNVRCAEEIGRMKEKQQKAKASAQASVNARSANAQRTLNERSANVELPTPTPTPTPNSSVPKGTDGKPSTDEIIFGYGVPLLTNAGTSDKQARSFLGGLRKSHGDEALVNALRDCIRQKPLQPLEWLAAVLPPSGQAPKKRTDIDQRRSVIAELTGKNVIEVGGGYVPAIEGH